MTETSASEPPKTARRVPDTLPRVVWLAATVSFCERFAYYGVTLPIQNYAQNPYHSSHTPGALGLGISKATMFSNLLMVWSSLWSFLSALAADCWIGRERTIKFAACFYVTGLTVLVCTSIPQALERGAGLGGFITAMLLLGAGAGSMSSNVPAWVADRYTENGDKTKLTSQGEEVIVDAQLTLQSIYSLLYWTTNVGSLSGLATSLHVGFWAAFVLPLAAILVLFALLNLCPSLQASVPNPKANLLHTIQVLGIGIKSKFDLEAAKSHRRPTGATDAERGWSDDFVVELQRGLVACRVFLASPIIWLCYGQMNSTLISQAAMMSNHGIPNDLLFNSNPIAVIIFLPILNHFLYPCLRRYGVNMQPIARMTVGCGFMALAMAYASGLQALIYSRGPCFHTPGHCEASPGSPNDVNVLLQLPAYLLIALSEIFFTIPMFEYSYAKAPPSMKSLIMSISSLSSGIGFGIGVCLSPAQSETNLVQYFAGLAAAAFATGVIFYALCRKYDQKDTDGGTGSARTPMDGGDAEGKRDPTIA